MVVAKWHVRKDVWGAEGISGRVKFLPLAWAGMPKTSFRKNSDSPLSFIDVGSYFYGRSKKSINPITICLFSYR
jgi:hypothetical protein